MCLVAAERSEAAPFNPKPEETAEKGGQTPYMSLTTFLDPPFQQSSSGLGLNGAASLRSAATKHNPWSS